MNVIIELVIRKQGILGQILRVTVKICIFAHSSPGWYNFSSKVFHCRLLFMMLLFSRSVVSSSFWDPMDCSPSGFSVHGIPRQAYWSELPFSSPEDLPDPGIKPGSPAWQVDSFPMDSFLGGGIRQAHGHVIVASLSKMTGLFFFNLQCQYL